MSQPVKLVTVNYDAQYNTYLVNLAFTDDQLRARLEELIDTMQADGRLAPDSSGRTWGSGGARSIKLCTIVLPGDEQKSIGVTCGDLETLFTELLLGSNTL